MTVNIKIKLGPEAQMPTRATPGSAGLDLYAVVKPWKCEEWEEERREKWIPPGARRIISTGVFLELPLGYEAQLRPRSGLASMVGLTILNAPATIDSDYRGEILVLLINHGPNPYCVNHGERIAQMVIHEVPSVALEQVPELSQAPNRDDAGFGSTGR